MNIPDLRHRLFLCAVFALALVLAGQAWERYQGRLSHLRLADMKAQWHETSRVPRDQELNEGFKLGYGALEREPASARYRFMLASMHAWREKGLRLWPDQAAAETEKVIENLKAALARRPSWFEAWILLALVKLQAGEVDQQLIAALEKAIETGRYETSVQHGVAYIGPRIRDQLGPAMREEVLTVMGTALDNRSIRRFVVEQIVMHDLADAFQYKLSSDAELGELVDRVRNKRNKAL